MRPPKGKIVCPFCHSPNLSVTLQQTLSAEAIRERQAEEQRAMEAAVKARGDTSEEQAPGFGSAMDQDEHVALMRKRSSSVSDAGSVSDADLSSVAMTADERQRLESQLRTQQQSPLIQRMQQEELERAFRNEREYMEHNAGRIRQRSVRGRRRDWARLIQAFEEGGGIQSMDDLAMLEAAMRMASAENDAGRRGGERAEEEGEEGGPSPLRRRMLDSRSSRRDYPSESSNSYLEGPALASQLFMRGMSEEEQLAMAIAASLEESGGGSQSANDDTVNNSEEASAGNSPPTTENEDNAATASLTHAADTPIQSDGPVGGGDGGQTTESSPGQAEPARERANSGPVDLDVSVSESNDDACGDVAPPVLVAENPTLVAPVGAAVEPTQPKREPEETSSENPPTVESTSTEDAAPVDSDEPPMESTVSDTVEIMEQVPLKRQDEPASVHAPPLTTAKTRPIVAQTGLPVSEVLGDVNDVTKPVDENPALVESTEEATPVERSEESAPAENAVDVGSVETVEAAPVNAGDDATPVEHQEAAEETVTVQDVEEAETYDTSECGSTEELKLPDETITPVATSSILPQDINDKTTVEPGMSC